MRKPLPVTGYTFDIYPDEKQKIVIFKTMIGCRIVYNDYLKIRKDAYTNEKKKISYYDCVKDLPEHIEKKPQLKSADSQALRSALKRLDNDYITFFNTRQNYPTFIRKKETNRWRYYKTINNGCNIELHAFDVRLPKIGRVPTINPEVKNDIHINEEPPGRILYAIVKYADKKFTATLYYTTEEKADGTLRNP